MKNFAIYIRVVCVLLCLTVIAGVILSVASKHGSTTKERSSGELPALSTEEKTETAQQNTAVEMQAYTGSLNKGHSKHTWIHDKEEHMLYIGDMTKPAIALTFDDGPSWEPTTRILDVLEAYGARATFFTMGYKAKTYADQLLREQALRCEVANHSYNHPKLTEISPAKVKKQITRTSKLVKGITGEGTHLVRPPYGAYDDTVLEQIDAPAILWSIDTRDWKTRDAEKTVANVLENVKDGDIILMHDVYEPTAEAVEKLVPELVARGYQLVTVPELAVLKGKKLKKGKTYNRISAD